MYGRYTKNTAKGFSIIELAIVVVAVGIIAAVGMVGYGAFSKQSSTVANAQQAGALYVALGDSYSSGVGSDVQPPSPFANSGVYDSATTTETNKCYRSNTSAARQLAAAKSYKLRDASCAGATTYNILTAGQYNEPRQLDKVTSDAALVTLTIGGNDAGLVGVLYCVSSEECTSQSSSVKYANDRLNTQLDRTKKVLVEIKKKAPNAKIRIAGYPKIMPNVGESTLGCFPWLASTEQTLVDNFERRINDITKKAVAAVGGNVKYVDPYASTAPFMQRNWLGQTYDVCSLSWDRWANGPSGSGAWHPNANGYKYYYQMYRASL